MFSEIVIVIKCIISSNFYYSLYHTFCHVTLELLHKGRVYIATLCL